MATPSNHLRALTRLEDPQQKWDVIKPDFLRMYIQEGISMEDAIAAIRESHGFNARYVGKLNIGAKAKCEL